MHTVTPEISKLADSPRTQKLKDLEKETVLFLQVEKKSFSTHEKL